MFAIDKYIDYSIKPMHTGRWVNMGGWESYWEHHQRMLLCDTGSTIGFRLRTTFHISTWFDCWGNIQCSVVVRSKFINMQYDNVQMKKYGVSFLTLQRAVITSFFLKVNGPWTISITDSKGK